MNKVSASNVGALFLMKARSQALKKYLWGICYGIFLTAFTVYVMLDTFVIARVYSNTPENSGNELDIVLQEE